MADLFHGLGYHRKSCFYCHLAAMHSVAFKMTRPDWTKVMMKNDGLVGCFDAEGGEVVLL
jgi:hypothetical protein